MRWDDDISMPRDRAFRSYRNGSIDGRRRAGESSGAVRDITPQPSKMDVFTSDRE